MNVLQAVDVEVEAQAIEVTDSDGHGAIGDMRVASSLLEFTAKARPGTVVVRAYVPEPTVAFSRKETMSPGFWNAVSAAAAHDFTPVVRSTGGKTVAYDKHCLVIDVFSTTQTAHGDNSFAFRSVGGQLSKALRSIGVHARLGPVPGEYCPGDYSINARGEVKLIGTAQRVTRGARLVSALVTVGETDHLVGVVSDVYSELSYDWRPQTLGSVGNEVPGVSAVGVRDVLVAELLGGNCRRVSYSSLASEMRRDGYAG